MIATHVHSSYTWLCSPQACYNNNKKNGKSQSGTTPTQHALQHNSCPTDRVLNLYAIFLHKSSGFSSHQTDHQQKSQGANGIIKPAERRLLHILFLNFGIKQHFAGGISMMQIWLGVSINNIYIYQTTPMCTLWTHKSATRVSPCSSLASTTTISCLTCLQATAAKSPIASLISLWHWTTRPLVSYYHYSYT